MEYSFLGQDLQHVLFVGPAFSRPVWEARRKKEDLEPIEGIGLEFVLCPGRKPLRCEVVLAGEIEREHLPVSPTLSLLEVLRHLSLAASW